jgi:hypothetical protein
MRASEGAETAAVTVEGQILQRLLPVDFATRGTELYAVLDGARDRRIQHRVETSQLAWRCLYTGAIPAELREVAPYLVHMPPQAAFTRATLACGWGHAWGIWLICAAPFDELHRHLRRFLRVRDEAGRRLLFRFYDPVVLEMFLPTCTPAELAELYGPIDAFLVETSAGAAIRELRFDGTALGTRVHALAPVPAADLPPQSR